MSDNFYVLRCHKCGRWNSKQIFKIESAILKCKFCGVSEKIRKKEKEGLAMDSQGPMTGQKAAKTCIYLNTPERYRPGQK